MPESTSSLLAHEWATLQNNHEAYERSGLLIKLGGMVLFVSGVALTLNAAILVMLMLILWVQEGILRTSQTRLGERILRVEQLLGQASIETTSACQLHTEWQAQRPGFGGLLAEYGKNMLRPTIAFPYAVLILLCFGASLPH